MSIGTVHAFEVLVLVLGGGRSCKLIFLLQSE